MNESEYLLGVNQAELERLRFQHAVWGHVTQNFFKRINIQLGWKCLDVGAGPGFVAMDLRERVGERGEITVLEPSKFYLDWFKEEVEKRYWNNITFVNGTAETAHLPDRYYDFIFSRWVIGFVPDPEKFLARLFNSLRPGGIIALQDYIYEGLSLFPRGGAFEGMADAIRAYWRSADGDPYIAARIPVIFKKHKVRLIDYTPNVLAGGPESGVMEWAHRFFTTHIQVMADKSIITQQEGDAMWRDWLEHRTNPDTIFVSPIVFDMAGVVPE
ncbi:MAG: methyltransferase domain-containing protein [Ignavibacteria bacterium]|nr:methyltransferase domain-containing protein [Ignavibacteria bacterium]MBI3765369.1 methyltransferase domain-containing protein [Ignavibacteriales bacterium]